MNASWHLTHRMPSKATPLQRLEWHLAHQRSCDCRELTPQAKKKLLEAASRYEKRLTRRSAGER